MVENAEEVVGSLVEVGDFVVVLESEEVASGEDPKVWEMEEAEEGEVEEDPSESSEVKRMSAGTHSFPPPSRWAKAKP